MCVDTRGSFLFTLQSQQHGTNTSGFSPHCFSLREGGLWVMDFQVSKYPWVLFVYSAGLRSISCCLFTALRKKKYLLTCEWYSLGNLEPRDWLLEAIVETTLLCSQDSVLNIYSNPGKKTILDLHPSDSCAIFQLVQTIKVKSIILNISSQKVSCNICVCVCTCVCICTQI